MNYKKEDKLWKLDITKETKMILGNIVKKAYYCISDYNTEEEAVMLFNDFLSKEIKANGIEMDAEKIEILFKNGSHVVFWNSEWGGIDKYMFNSNFKEKDETAKIEELSDDELKLLYCKLEDLSVGISEKDPRIIELSYLNFPDDEDRIDKLLNAIKNEMISRWMK